MPQRSIFRLMAMISLLASAPVAARRAGAQGRLPPPSSSARPINARAFGTIDGVVSDTNLTPIQAAFVSILGTKIRVGTGPNGRFRIVNVPAGEYLVIVKRVGYRPTSGVVDVAVSDTLRLAYTLDRVTESLEPVIVTEKTPSVRMLEFAQRRKLGIGQFMDADQIDKHNSVYPTELFRHFTSVNVSPSNSSSITQYYALSAREGGSVSMQACPMQLVLDQVPLPTPFNLDLLPPPKDIAGIEVYSGPSTTPQQFSGYNRGCGVILVWTKVGY